MEPEPEPVEVTPIEKKDYTAEELVQYDGKVISYPNTNNS